MKQFILSLFGLGNKLSQIQSKSDGALISFKRTLNKLKSVEEKILAHNQIQEDIIAEANKVKTALNNVKTSNAKIVAKLEDFLGVN